MNSLVDLANRFLSEKSQDTSTSQPLSDGPPRASCFALNAGSNPTAPPVRQRRYTPGQRAIVESPLFGRFEAEVLNDDGVTVWIFSPHTKRETAIPNRWLIEEAEA